MLSVIYRIWAGVRAAQLRDWQETWVHKSLHGGRACHETLDGVFETNLHIEHAQQEGKPFFLLLLDYKKFFEFNPGKYVGLATWWGMPTGIVKLLKAFYYDLSSVLSSMFCLESL